MSYQALAKTIQIRDQWTTLLHFTFFVGLWVIAASSGATELEHTHFQANSNQQLDVAESYYDLNIDLPSAGILNLEVLPAAGSETTVSLHAAPAGSPNAAAILGRSMNRMTFAAPEAGSVRLRVSSQDLTSAVGSVHVIRQFMAASVEQTTHRVLPRSSSLWDGDAVATRTVLKPAFSGTKTDLEEVDPNPGGLRLDEISRRIEVLRISGGAPATKTDLEEVDPNPGGLRAEEDLQLTVAWAQQEPMRFPKMRAEHPLDRIPAFATLQLRASSEAQLDAGISTSELEIPRVDLSGDADLAIERIIVATEQKLLQPSWTSSVEFLGLCEGRMGSSFRCAARLEVGKRLKDQVGLYSAEDLKVYRFDLSETTALEIRAEGDRHLTQTLFRGSGERITSTEGSGLNLVRSLAPGSYFLALEGAGGRSFELTTRRLR